MESNLRPLSLSEILDRTAEFYRAHFLLLAGIAVVPPAINLGMGLLNLGLQQGLRAAHLPLSAQTLSLLVAGMVALGVYGLVGGVTAAVNTRAVSWICLGHPATIGSAWRSIRPRLGRLVWLMTILVAVVWGPFAVLYAIMMGLLLKFVPAFAQQGSRLAPSATPGQAGMMVFGLSMLLILPLLLLSMIYMILMGLRYSLAVAACVVEDLPARAAIRRSIDLSKESRGRIFVLGLLVTILTWVVTLATQFPFILLALQHKGQPAPVWQSAVSQIIATVTGTLIGPIYATGLTLFYYDQRIRKEGYDIEWMMQAAGLEALPLPPFQTSATDAAIFGEDRLELTAVASGPSDPESSGPPAPASTGEGAA